MKSLLIQNINLLAGIREANTLKVAGGAMKELPALSQAFLLAEDGVIKDFGPQSEAPERADEIIDATGKMVLPAWCDSHTHLVYAGSRENEFNDKINGLTYEEIAARGGGILNSALKLQQADEQQLLDSALQRLEEIAQMGTGSVEIKSGYGLSYEGEMKMLRVIRQLKEKSKLSIKATFLGAHAYPAEFKQNHKGYIDLLIHQLLPEITREGLADFIDVFCEQGYFTIEETQQIIEAGAKYGLPAKLHVNQFNILGGVAMAVHHNALSVDHLEHVSDDDIKALQTGHTMPVALPGCSLYLQIPYTPARKIIDAGLPLALATDYNPGSCPSGNMNLVQSLACINMKMTVEEAINAATLNGAYAMDLAQEAGSITKGKKAKLILTEKASSLSYLPYSFGRPAIERVWL